MKKAVVTGSSGYIGGQTSIELKENGYTVLGVDRRPVPEHLKKYFDKFVESDVVDAISDIAEYDAVVHCAGSSLVGPSILNPAEYYLNNVGTTAKLIKGLSEKDWRGRFVFSSSAAVYGQARRQPVYESSPLDPINPYGRSKLYCEQLLTDSARAYRFTAVCLRYFNACGADTQGRHGQETSATHVFAQLFESIKNNQAFKLYGNQYDTRDGTCIRDYIHVSDIARAHRFSLEKSISTGNNIFNIGTSQGYSVQEIIDEVGKRLGKQVRVQVVEPRSGDPAELVANGQRFAGYFEFDTHYSDLPTIITSLKKWYRI